MICGFCICIRMYEECPEMEKKKKTSKKNTSTVFEICKSDQKANESTTINVIGTCQ